MSSISDQIPNGDGACDSGEKQCRSCGQCFPATPEYFSRDKKGRNGLHYRCKTCSRAASQRYKKQNRADVLAYNKRWEAEHRQELLDYKKQYREAHKKEIASYLRQYREENAEAIAEDKRRYHAANPEKGILRSHKRRTRINKAGGSYTEADVQALYALQQGRCCWCGKRMANRMLEYSAPKSEKYTIDHVRPVYRQGTSYAWNIVLACRRCNGSHHSKHVFTEWEPPAMLEWMVDYVVRATVLEFILQIMRLKTKSAFRFRFI